MQYEAGGGGNQTRGLVDVLGIWDFILSAMRR